jgi:hypothetical protein
MIVTLMIVGLLASTDVGMPPRQSIAAAAVLTTGAHAINQPGLLPTLPRQELAWRLAREGEDPERET